MASMQCEFTEHRPDPEAQPSPNPGAAPPGRRIGTDLLEADEAVPPRGLVPRRWHVSLWLAVALLLGAIVAYFLIGYAVE
jgi:hypothetical protein